MPSPKPIAAGASNAPLGPLLRILPPVLVPYAELVRLDKPHGVFVGLFSHTIGLMYAKAVQREISPTISTVGRLLLWLALCRSGACAWNDVVDQDFDRQTERCRTRAIARGAVTTRNGCITAVGLAGLALFPLSGLPYPCLPLGLLAISLSTIYPFAKRFTNFPQFILGAIAGVTVAIAAYAANVDALSGALRGPTICLIGTVILHLVFYDIAYAQQDAQDDMKSGVKGMAVLFYNRIPSLLGVLASGATGLVYWLGRMVNFGPAFFLVGVGGQILSLGGAVVLNQLGLQTELKKVAWLCFVMTACSLIGAFATQI